MKFMRPVAMLCALGITVGGVTALAAAQGSQEDPLITLSYLESVLRPDLEKQVDKAVEDNQKALTDKLDAAIAAYEKQVDEAIAAAPASAFQTRTLAAGESFTPGAGREVLVVSGSLTALGTLTDTTDGASVAAGETLREAHLYIAADAASGCRAAGSATVMGR